MKTPLQLFSIDLVPIQKRIKSLPATKLSKLDGILSDAANEVYDTYDCILLLADTPEKVNDFSEKEFAALQILSKQTTAFLDLLEQMNYDSKYMDRLQMELSSIEDELPVILRNLKSVIHNKNQNLTSKKR